MSQENSHGKLHVNIKKVRKDLPQDSDISRLFLGEEQDPKSKFKCGGSAQTPLRLQRSLLSWWAQAGPRGCP